MILVEFLRFQFCVFSSSVYFAWFCCSVLNRDVFIIFKLSKMELEHIISLRMAISALILLLLVQFPRTLASGFEIKSKICGADHIAYSNFLGDEFFYINGNLVDKDSFCKTLHFHHANDCVFESYFGSSYCELDLSLGMC